MLCLTRNLKGNQLTWAVAKAVGVKLDICGKVLWFAGTEMVCEFAECGEQASDLIEKNKISITSHEFPWFDCEAGWYGHKGDVAVRGDTMIEAAMRCLVVVQLGDTIEIPNEVN